MFIFFITNGLFYPIFGQNYSRVNYSISTNISQYLFLDFPVTFEKYFNRHTLGLTVSFRPATKDSAVVTGGFGAVPGTGYVNQNFHNFLYNGLTIGLNSKYFFTTSNRFYFDAHLFYRYWWFDKKYAVYKENVEAPSEYHFNGIRSENQNIFGLRLLIGMSKVYREGNRIMPIINLYAGTGIRYKIYNFETYNGFVNGVYFTYKKDTWSQWVPTIEFGMNIGFVVNK